MTARAVRDAEPRGSMTLTVADSAISAFDLSDCGRCALTMSDDGVVRIWDLATGDALWQRPYAGQAEGAAAFLRGGNRVVMRDADGTITLRRASDGVATPLNDTAPAHVADDFRTSPCGRWLLTLSSYEAVVWDLAAEQRLHDLRETVSGPISAAFSPNGERLAVGGGNWRPDIDIFDTGSGEWITTADGAAVGLGPDPAVPCFSPDGRYVYVASDRRLTLWPTEEADVPRLLDGTSEQMAFSSDGTWVAVTRGGYGFDVDVFDTERGDRLQTLVAFAETDPVTEEPHDLFGADHRSQLSTTPVFLGQTRHLATFSGAGVVKVWDGDTGERLNRLEGLCFGCTENGGVLPGISADGSRVAARTWDETKVWDTRSGAVLATMQPACKAYRYSADRRWLAGLDHRGALHIWPTV